MGLRCLIGHDYGPPQSSRDTRERGNEIVVTVTEYNECRRCGHQRVLSESKEVKAGTPAEPAPAPDEEPVWGDEADAPAEAAEPSWSAATGGSVGRQELSAEEDDGVILEDEPERPGRGRGEWPDAGEEADADAAADDGGTGGDHAPWPDQAGDDEGYDAAPVGDEPAAAVEFGGSLTPEAVDETPDAEATSAAAPPDADGDGGGDIIDAEAAGAAASAAGSDDAGTAAPDRPGKFSGTPERRPDDRDTEFACPECGETWPAVSPSLRPGDICPECRRGYLAEQVVQ